MAATSNCRKKRGFSSTSSSAKRLGCSLLARADWITSLNLAARETTTKPSASAVKRKSLEIAHAVTGALWITRAWPYSCIGFSTLLRSCAAPPRGAMASAPTTGPPAAARTASLGFFQETTAISSATEKKTPPPAQNPVTASACAAKEYNGSKRTTCCKDWTSLAPASVEVARWNAAASLPNPICSSALAVASKVARSSMPATAR
mmetsp:Transcript_6782/g.21900  ORF Transcript_6782/g.21900 Transcript_6782/m.21900 type:complete len:205 (+) Transcript_6782:629-1243(+)